MKHTFKPGEGFIGTREERKILQKLILEKGYAGTYGFCQAGGNMDFVWNGNQFYLTEGDSLITNPISFELFKILLSDNSCLEPQYEIY